jgi:uncharacterized membrane protein YdjX (TVP38/TMEM64 family)
MKTTARRWLIVGAVVFVLASLAAAWKWTPLAEWADPDAVAAYFEPLRSEWYGLPVVLAVFVLAELVLFPVLVLVVVCGIAFGPVQGPLYALAGSLLSALPPFFIGRRLGRKRVENWGGALARRVAKALDRKGVIAVFLVRKVPAPYSIVNLVCGASPVSLRDFILGTLLGMGTGVILLTVLGSRMMDLIRDPSVGSIAFAIGLLVAPAVIALGIQRWINNRTEHAS